jgi:multidrug efflux pump subunit AcrA (membrane-fusion protein)
LRGPTPELLAEVPLSAIFQQGKEPAVWVVDKATSTVSLRPVTISRWRDETALIASGVQNGDVVASRRRAQARARTEDKARPAGSSAR